MRAISRWRPGSAGSKRKLAAASERPGGRPPPFAGPDDREPRRGTVRFEDVEELDAGRLALEAPALDADVDGHGIADEDPLAREDRRDAEVADRARIASAHGMDGDLPLLEERRRRLQVLARRDATVAQEDDAATLPPASASTAACERARDVGDAPRGSTPRANCQPGPRAAPPAAAAVEPPVARARRPGRGAAPSGSAREAAWP